MKVVYKLFFLPEYEQEEAFLRKMSKQGYALVSIQYGCKYVFEEVNPKDVVYRLDFNINGDDSYKQLYIDYGWEYITTVNDFYYFRKDASEADLEIFNDNESRNEMAQSIKTKKLMPLVLNIIANTSLYTILLNQFKGASIIMIIWAMLILLNVYAIVRCFIGFKQLHQKYGKVEK